MASLLSSAQKTALQSAFNDLHDTFARDIFIYKEAQSTIISTNPSYNPIYQENNAQSKTVKRKVISASFKARITYDTDRSQSNLTSPEVESQLKLKLPDGYVRIKVAKDGYDYLKDAKRVEFDGRKFSIESDVRPHGLFEPTHYTFFLLPTEE
tara:strand:+ start:253 stop:711 length:459 start_codon:yes stop_codon:yes gene_type:complete